LNHAIETITAIIMMLFGLVMEVIGVVDTALAGLMTSVGLPANLQVIVLLVAAVLLIIFAIRVLGGVFGVLLVILLLLLIVHRLVPGMLVPHSNSTAPAQQSGQQQL
jgi:hypothetical protein